MFGPGKEQGQPSTLETSNPGITQAPSVVTSYNSELDSMNCPICSKPMEKFAWEITNNNKSSKDFKQYAKNSYKCVKDDVWLVVEIPKNQASNNSI